MTGFEIAMLMSTLGNSVLGAVTAPEGQELRSFTGSGNTDPREMVADARSGINGMIDLMRQRIGQPVALRSAYVQQPPTFSGGGLPSPIGVSGVDPALADSSLLSIPGLDMPEGLSSFTQPNAPGMGVVDQAGQRAYDAVRSRFGGPRQTPNRQNPNQPTGHDASTTPRRRNAASASSNTGVTNVSEYDDLPQGMGAVELLLRSRM